MLTQRNRHDVDLALHVNYYSRTMNPQELGRIRIGIVADAHHSTRDETGPRQVVRFQQALGLLESFVAFCHEQRFDFVVDLGDRITETGHDQDLGLAAEVSARFDRLSIPRGHVMGNHDAYTLTPYEWEGMLGRPLTSHSLDVAGYHLVFLSPDVNNLWGQVPYILTPADLTWLAADLAATRLPAIVFTHVPLCLPNLIGNYYAFTEGSGCFQNQHAAHAILKDSPTVLSLAGHVHRNSWHVRDGVHYLSIQSLSESWTTSPFAAGAVAILEIAQDITLTVHGRDPFRITLPIRAAGQSWLGN